MAIHNARVYSFLDKKSIKETFYKIGEKVDAFFTETGPEKYSLEYRDGQYDMSCQIIDTLMKERHLLVEAGVGIGKTFAYLLPIIYVNKFFKWPIFIATTTIALQDQLKADIEKICKFISVNADVILIKGQNHYVCLKRSKQYFDKRELTKDELFLQQSIEHGTQDESEFLVPISAEIWDEINIKRRKRKECDSCEYRNECVHYISRAKLTNFRGIVLCNQDLLNAHLLSVDLGNEGILNQEGGVIVIDEAHNLESKVRSSTTFEIERKNLLNIVFGARKGLGKRRRYIFRDSLGIVIRNLDSFFQLLNDIVRNQINADFYNMQYAERFAFGENEKALNALFSLKQSISDFIMDLDLASDVALILYNHDTEEMKELRKYEKYLNDLIKDIENWLIWIERTYSNNHYTIKFCYCPKNTKDIIQNLYFSGNNLCIFTSATLRNCSNGTLTEQYKYFINNTGFPLNENGTVEEAKESPFSYDKNAMIYYCNDMPHPTKEHEKFISLGTERLIQLLNISNGKALVLFTAKSDMFEVYNILKSKLLPFKILMQSKGMSQNQVIEAFRSDINSVLLGTGTYWEGISLEGETLSNLIVFRLPFPIPDPIMNYKISISSNRLMDVLVPEMIIKLKQGIGRLIRNYTDRGIVSIIDGRLSDENPTPYHDIVWNSLPIKNRTADIKRLDAFYKTLYSH